MITMARIAVLVKMIWLLMLCGIVAADEDNFSSAYFITRENSRLAGYLVKKIESTSFMSCSHSCLRHSWCTSTNFKDSVEQGDKGSCELNKHGFVAPTNDDAKLIDEPETTFTMMLKGCLMTGCRNGGSCLFDKKKETFTCCCKLQRGGDQCESECRELSFPSFFSFADKRLVNHTIRIERVPDLDTCEFVCYQEPNCVSINFGMKASADGTFSCELNNATHRRHDDELVNKAGYVYRGTESVCDVAHCDNNGICQSGFTDKKYRCLCPSGFTGEQCDEDVNECAPEKHSCSNDAVCYNTKGSYHCTCKPGYTGDGRNCTDVNECAPEKHSCSNDAVCYNTKGSYFCTCKPGYTGDGRSCADIDECKEGIHDCYTIGECINSNGSYRCTVPVAVALFPLNATYGTQEINNRTAQGIPNNVHLAPGPNGKANGSYKFLGTSDSYIEFPNSAGGRLDVRYSITMLCWLYHDGQDGPLFNYRASGDKWGVHLWVLQDKLYVRFNKRYYSETDKLLHTPVAGGWKFVGASYDNVSGEAKLWVDGVAVQKKNIGVGMELATQDSISMGVKNGDGKHFKGRIAQMEVYSEALTHGQIQTIQGRTLRVEDINECEDGTNNCSTDAICIKTKGSFNCTCKTGYVGDGLNCTDINECEGGTHNCSTDGICNNTKGSHNCTCKTGYVGDGRNCTDINECVEGTHTCGAYNECINSKGSYRCTVPEPVAFFPLNAEYHTKEINNRVAQGIPSGINLAPGPKGKANGSYEFLGNSDHYIEFNNSAEGPLDVRFSMTMLCWVYYGGKDGPIFNYNNGVYLRILYEMVYARFIKRDDNSIFVDLLHTQLPASGWKFVGASYDHGSGKAKLWVDGVMVFEEQISSGAGLELATQGNIRMGVMNGYPDKYFKGRIAQMQVYNKALTQEQIQTIRNRSLPVDINECEERTHNCSTDAICNNTKGSFNCTCKTGYVGDGRNCTDINECEEGTHNCSTDGICNNTKGSHNCTCKTGYVGDGRNCTDINECEKGTHNCSINAMCYNTNGSYECTCNPGFTADGRNCTDINECEDGTNHCANGDECINLMGSYRCRDSEKVYRLEVRTSSGYFTGTDAPVWIKISGNNGSYQARLDTDPASNYFESGTTDSFSLKANDVGTATMVWVYRGYGGWSPSWHLDYIKIDDQYFDYKGWVRARRWIKLNKRKQ